MSQNIKLFSVVIFPFTCFIVSDVVVDVVVELL